MLVKSLLVSAKNLDRGNKLYEIKDDGYPVSFVKFGAESSMSKTLGLTKWQIRVLKIRMGAPWVLLLIKKRQTGKVDWWIELIYKTRTCLGETE